jgi:Spy/CpxP family protein refolding chaperone
LESKSASVVGRVESSEKEIKTLNAKIANLSKSKSEPEVQNLIETHQASINHHTDISAVAKTELIHDREQQEEIKRAMENLLKELKKTPSKQKVDKNKINDEIEQLKESQTTLEQARLRIVALINKLDPNRTPTGASKILNECDQKKRKLDDAFSRTPGSTPGNKQAKRMRPATPKSTPQRATRQQEQQQIAEIPTMDVELTANPAPALLAPFLPPTAAKLLLLVDGRFSSIEWYDSTTKIPMTEDISNSFGTWTTTLQTGHHHFLMQTYTHSIGSFGLLPPEYRIIVIDPAAQIHKPDTQCVPLATTKNKQEAVQFLDLIGEIEDHPSFDIDATWRLLSKDS